MIKTEIQHVEPPPLHPFWMRAVAALSLLLVFIASSVQASHAHRLWTPHTSSRSCLQVQDSQGLDTDANCPLCMAMHSALPRGASAGVQLLQATSCSLPAWHDRVATQPLHFSLFSRPPPASINC